MSKIRKKGSETTVNDIAGVSLMLFVFALRRCCAEGKKELLYLPHGNHNHIPPQLLRIRFHILWAQIAEGH